MGNLKKQRFGWYVYDWANSAFSASVVTVFLGPYLTSVAKAAVGPDGNVSVGPLSIHPGAVFSYAVSISVFLQVFLLPMIGAVTDRMSDKRVMLGATAFIGAIATSALFFLSVDSGNFLYGALCFIVANLSFGASIVVANAFLPFLANAEEADKVSSRGWALGYLGGGLLLLAHLLYFNSVDSSGGSTSMAVRVILTSVGIWWAAFTLIPLKLLPKGVRPDQEASSTPSIKRSFLQLWHTLKGLGAAPMTLTFFVAYLLYNDAVQTVIAMASVYGQEELGLGLDVLTTAILIVQFVAMGGALFFERIASLIGTKRAIILSLFGWSGVLIAAYTVVSTEFHFYVLAGVIALVMGGTQALSRSQFSVMIPKSKEAEYFSLYEISDKGTSWLGPLVFGLALQMTNSYRAAVLSLIIFLVAGLLLLMRVNVARAIEEGKQA